MRPVLAVAVLLAVVGPGWAGEQDGQEGWYLVKAVPGERVTVTQRAMTAYGCGVQASFVRKTAPTAMVECVFLQRDE